MISSTIKRTPGLSVFALGFRPFFLLAALGGSSLMLIWLLILNGHLFAPGIIDPLQWHRHEMLFGYTGAVVAGFLLTAVRRWTGQSTPDGWPLALLALVWLAARLTPLLINLPWLYIGLDLAFWIGLFLALWNALSRAETRNRIFLLLVALLGGAAAISHAPAFGSVSPWLSHLGAHLGLDLLVIIMLVMGGRVIPFFIQMGLQRQPFNQYSWLTRPLPVLLALMLLVDLLLPLSIWSGLVNLLLACWILPNLLLWHDTRLWKNPLLWSLYLAYAWLVIGLFMRGMGMLELINPYLGIHALTTGGIGLLTLSMMSRVGLGHTGRPLKTSALIQLALLLMLSAGIVRVFMSSWMGILAYQVSAVLWSSALLLYLLVFLPILTRPRPDGQPG
ncbi:MAG: NnrS family protein [Marinospirillum sp.]|uniref:NnrS family protein n=1 Tax=Marinospirillum sp. TaxID=2183934 RepID=UPI0019E16B15|nr:NnrS family protein [Marinospirillum sp.]MBE0506381.1 NnrS family protein [Marinospirillum sp.]